MKNSLDYLWRLIATAVCFVCFGLGGLILSLVIFPFIHLLPLRNKSLRARWVISKSFGMFVGLMQITGVLHVRISGSEQLRRCNNVLILANHPTLIDVIILLALMPTANCVVKRALWDNPFIGMVVRGANYISNDEPESLIKACSRELELGTPILIFPEGTRSQPGKALRFRRGAAYITMHGHTPVLPVIIHCNPPTLVKGEKWYKIPPRKAQMQILVNKPITPDQWLDGDDEPGIAARKLTHALEHYFTEALSSYERTTLGNQAADY